MKTSLLGEKRFRDLANGKTIPEHESMKASPPQTLTPSEQKHFDDWLPEEFQQVHDSRKDHAHPLGDIPLVVLAAGKGEGNAYEPARAAQLTDMETLSTNSKGFIDESSYHGIPIENPELVTRSVREVYLAAKTHRRVSSTSLAQLPLTRKSLPASPAPRP
jgi:hypothetical protein